MVRSSSTLPKIQPPSPSHFFIKMVSTIPKELSVPKKFSIFLRKWLLPSWWWACRVTKDRWYSDSHQWLPSIFRWLKFLMTSSRIWTAFAVLWSRGLMRWLGRSTERVQPTREACSSSTRWPCSNQLLQLRLRQGSRLRLYESAMNVNKRRKRISLVDY